MMSSRTHRPKSPVHVKQAFEENANRNIKDMSDKHGSSLNGNNIDLNRAFFTINGSTFEVILDHDILSWSSVSYETSREEIHHKENKNSIDLHHVYAVTPVYHRLGWLVNNNENQTNISSSSSSQLSGFQLHSYERIDDNILQEIHIIFRSTFSHQIERWYQLLSRIITEYKPSRNILVICNPYAGSRYSRHVYNTKIQPMFERAQYNVTYFEISDRCSADEVLSDFQGDFDSLYGLVIIGGDGSVINVINALLRYLAKENRMRLDIENQLPSLPFPICIVPIGTTNIICHSVHGNIDHCTPIFHLLFNQQLKIDMSAIFDVNHNFVTANFSAGAGYPANALQYFTRYSLYHPKKIVQKSFAKAASNKNLKSIEMKIRYIPADQNNPNITRCYQGCPTCTATAAEHTDDQVKIFDDGHVQKIDKRKKPSASNNGNRNNALSSSRTSSCKKNDEENQWKILHHNYLQVAVLTNANLSPFAPQGLSKFGHLADGLLDLVLIEQTTRKNFLRSIKRHGNSKNQYEFSFTNLIKVKEIELELKFPNDRLTNKILNIDDEVDSTLSDDSSNENKSSFIQIHEPHPPMVPISEDSRRHRRRHYHRFNGDQQEKYSEEKLDSPSNVPFRQKNISQLLKLKKDKISIPRPSSVCGAGLIDKKQKQKNQQSASGTLRPTRSFLNLLMGGSSTSEKHEQSSTIKQEFSSATINNGSGRRSSMISRLSCVENEKTSISGNNQYQNKKQPCMWNLDFTPYNSPLIRIKCFYRFLPVFGVGLHPDTMIKEVNYSCFGRFG